MSFIPALLGLLILAAPAAASRPDLTGRVTGEGGAPIAGAMIILQTAEPREGTSPLCPTCHPDCAKWARTDAEGRYRIASLDPALNFRVLFIAEGFESTFVNRVDPDGGPLDVPLARIEPARLGRGHVIRGIVLDPQGQAVVGATLEPFSRRIGNQTTYGSMSGISALSATDAEGKFILASDQPGIEVGVKVRARGLATQHFTLRATDDAEHRLGLNVGASVAGRIVREGRPAAGMRVALRQMSRDMATFVGPYSVGTDEQGRFGFGNVLAGESYFLYSELSRFEEAGCLEARKVNTGAVGSSTDAGELAAGPAFRFIGRVVPSDGKPLPESARLTLTRDEIMDSLRLEFDGEGRFEARGLPPANYSLSVSVDGYHPSSVTGGFGAMKGSRITGSIQGHVDDLRIVLSPGAPPPPTPLPRPVIRGR